jgi:hypothetical protein
VERISGGRIPVEEGARSSGESAPALVIQSGGRDRIRYQAIPAGPEEEPFFEALLAMAGGCDPEGAGLSSLPPTELTVFIAASCPNCPTGVRAAIGVAAAAPETTVSIVDVAEFPDRAERIGVRSVPTIVTQEGLTVVGTLSMTELAARILAHHEADGDELLLGSLMDAGRFAAAGELLAAGRGHGAFLSRWRSSGMESRIGLVLAADDALSRSAEALDGIVPSLLELLAGGDTARRGDTADLLGRIGHPAARSWLEQLASDADEELAEAAADALEVLDERDQGTV